MIRSEGDTALWRRFSGSLREQARLLSFEARLSPRTSGRGGGEAKAELASHPHPEVAAKRPSKDEDALLRLAAWLDGRLEGAEAEALEAWLAADPDRLDLAVAAAGSRGLLAPWPGEAQERARRLGAPARPPLRLLAAAAAAVLVVALGGFEMGRAGSEWLVVEDASEIDLAADLGLVPDIDLMESLL